MLDFHTHILPGIDDGSRSVEMSLQMLQREAELGIDEVISTSHYYATEGSPEQFLHRRERAWEKLRPHVTSDMPAIRLGAEVQYFEGICAAEGIDLLRIEGSELLLLEMPTIDWSQRMLEDIMELNSRPGMQVVLAHIDRYLNFLPKGLVGEFVEAGVLIQVNASFFTRWNTLGKAKKMLKNGQIHFVGSDCHSMGSRRPNWDQVPAKVMQQLEEVSGRNARRLLRESAASVDTL